MPATTLLAALAVASAAAALPAVAAEPITITFDDQGNRGAEVDISAYDLTTDKGFKEAEHRVASAARSVCTSNNPNRLRAMYDENVCERSAVSSARQQMASLAQTGVQYAKVDVKGAAN